MNQKLQAVVERHKAVYPALGNIVEVFTQDNYQCVRWSNGEWYHYDTDKKTWW